MKFVCIMVVPWTCCMLFEFSWQNGPCTTTIRTRKISSVFFCPWLLNE